MNLENLNLVELNALEGQEVDGGFIPLVILGVTYAAPVVAGWCAGAFALGFAAGGAAYLATK
jgi:hypothetical protein